MKLNEFVLTHTFTRTKGVGNRETDYIAEVSVTTGALWWKRTERRKIYRQEGCQWFFMDSGELTPTFQVERLERAYRARDLLRELEQEK